MQDTTSARIVRQLQELLGPAVLLPIPAGEKGPTMAGWQQATLADMNPENLACLDAKENIGVLLGKASAGLCSIDIDDDGDIEPFLALNPKLTGTLRTKGRRGCNFWVRITGDFPPLGKFKDAAGRDRGEWRADGGQTVIWGTHPSGCKYQRLVREHPLEIEFADIKWPADWQLPWTTTPESEIEAEHGAPYTISPKGRVTLNVSFFAAKFAKERLTLWHPAEAQFYQYVEQRGIWQTVTPDAIKHQFAQDLKGFADLTGVKEILTWRNNSSLDGLTELLKGHTEKPDAFSKDRRLIHVQNGVLDLSTDPPQRHGFSPEFYSRNQAPFDFIDGAACPRFRDELLGSALEEDDISLLQRWCGAVLLQHNAAQKILLLMGTPGGGKSTVADVIERVLGPENCAELRTELLYERFELSRFIGKVLLSGKDVPSNFLQSRGATALKKLVGHDLLSAELKRANGILSLRGDFHVLCTCNTRLQIRLDGDDADAWKRRLLVIEYGRPKPEKPVRDFADKLIESEGPGILFWMLQGAVLHMAELDECGDYRLTERQQARIQNLLDESDSLNLFVRQCIQADREADVTTEELLEAYFDFADARGWRAKDRTAVCAALPSLMLEVHHTSRCHDVVRDGKAQRGYHGFTLCHSDDPF